MINGDINTQDRCEIEIETRKNCNKSILESQKC